MLIKKPIDVFDVENIKVGYFITYTRLTESVELDDGQEVVVYVESYPTNAIVKEVSEERVIVFDMYERKRTIRVEDLVSKEQNENPEIKILGVKPSAI